METRTYLKVELFILNFKRQDKITTTCTTSQHGIHYAIPLDTLPGDTRLGFKLDQISCTQFTSAPQKYKYNLCLTYGLFTHFELQTVIS